MHLTLEISDQCIYGQNQSQIAEQIKLYGSLLMFQLGQLSRGAAYEFAGVVIYDFFLACKQHQISAINIPVESIEADVSHFQHLTPILFEVPHDSQNIQAIFYYKSYALKILSA